MIKIRQKYDDIKSYRNKTENITAQDRVKTELLLHPKRFTFALEIDLEI
jgi:hypothetical protein